MGLYSYEVVDRIGRPGSGQMVADDEMIVAEKLRNMGLTVWISKRFEWFETR